MAEPSTPISVPVGHAECREDTEAAWCALHQQYVPIAGGFLRKLGVPDAELEDATQEVFLQMFRYFRSFRGQSSVSTWLYKLCVTQARQVRRAARLRQVLHAILAQSPSERVMSSPGYPEQIARRKVERALGELTPSEREVFVLFEMEGVPGKEVAKITGCTEARVWTRLHAARTAFKRALTRETEELGG